MNLIHSMDVIRYVKASANRAGLNVVFEQVNRPRHDGKTIYLPQITKETTEDELLHLLASTDHEVAHDLYSDFGLLKEKKLDTSSGLGQLWNILEDSRVNSIEADEYLGFRNNWDTSNAKLLASIRDKIAGVSNPEVDFISSIIFWDSASNAKRFPAMASEGEQFAPRKEVMDVLIPLTNELEDVRNILPKVEGSKATLDLACKIFDALGGNSKEELEKMAKKGTDKGERGEEGEDGESTDSEATGKEGEQKDSDDWSIVEVDYSKISSMMPSNHDEEYIHNRTGLKKINGDSSEYPQWYAADDFVTVNYVTPNGYNSRYDRGATRIDGYRHDLETYVRSKGTGTIDNFAQQVRRLIQINSRVRYEHGVKKGKLDQSRLARICLKDAQGFNERIFKRKIETKLLDAAISVLVDDSGSMAGMKHFNTVEACVYLNEVFGSVLHIPLEILSFTDKHSGEPLMFVSKEFDKRISEENLLLNFCKTESHMNGNPDGDCVLFAYDRLVKRKEKKKLLIVLSDGAPAASRGAFDIEGYTKTVTKNIEKEGIVDLYGVGILDDNVAEYYKHYTVINHANEIADKLLQIIEEKVLNNV